MKIEIKCPACNRENAANLFALAVNSHVVCHHCCTRFEYIDSPTYVPAKAVDTSLRQSSAMADAEMRVASQQRLIKRLKQRGFSTQGAEKRLRTFNMTLLELRNHYDIRTALEFAPGTPRAEVRSRREPLLKAHRSRRSRPDP